MSDNDWIFSEDNNVRQTIGKPQPPIKLLIVDDDVGVHQVTKLALQRFDFYGAKLEFLHAYSGAEAKKVFAENKDIAVVFLDVVMESSSAGLEVANWIRNDQKEKKVRIVLRTGQPGEAPESDIMVRYDINDYKEKTELTNRKLNTLMYACLRAYSDILTIERASSKLKSIVESSSLLFRAQSGESFSKVVIELLSQILEKDKNEPPSVISSITSKNGKIVFASGKYENSIGKDAFEILGYDEIKQVFAGDDDVILKDDEIYAYLKSDQNEFLIFVERLNVAADIDRDILSLFFRHVSIGYQNIQDSFNTV